MKEASGELSMTAVAVVAIAAIGVLFTTLIWPAIKQTILRNTYCSQAFNCSGDGDTVTCSYYDEEGNKQDGLVCPNDTTGFKNGTGTGGTIIFSK